MTSPAVTAIVEALRRFEKRDADAIAASFAAEGVFIDPHYPPPIGPAVAGREAIRAAVAGVFGVIQQPGFTVRQALWSENPAVAAVEVDTHHLMADGTTVNFPQVFVGEIDPAGLLLLRLQSYLPYPPPVG